MNVDSNSNFDFDLKFHLNTHMKIYTKNGEDTNKSHNSLLLSLLL